MKNIKAPMFLITSTILAPFFLAAVCLGSLPDLEPQTPEAKNALTWEKPKEPVKFGEGTGPAFSFGQINRGYMQITVRGNIVFIHEKGTTEIDGNTGKVTFHGVTPEEAAVSFWKAVEKLKEQYGPK